jgi:hypothetical protein
MEEERALNQKASHEVNQGLRDFEVSKNQTIQLHRVKLITPNDSKSSSRTETFNEIVTREIH